MNLPATEIHKPSKKQAILFFFFTLAAAAGVLAWVFFLNKGTLVVEGAAPFSVYAGAESVNCSSSPCSLKLVPRKYTISAKKDGFFDESGEIEIKRWVESKFAFSFKMIPKLNLVGKAVLPNSFVPLRPPFLGASKLEKFPQGVAEATAAFSASGEKALLTLGKDFYIYDAKNPSVTKLDIPASYGPIWAGEKIVFLEDSASGQILKLWNNGNSSPIVSFERPFKFPTLLGSQSGKYVLIAEKTGDDTSYYLVDTTNKTRKKMAPKIAAYKANWAGDYIIFEENIGKQTNVSFVDAASLSEKALPAVDSLNVISPRSGVIVFVSNHKKDGTEARVGLPIAEALMAEAKKEAFQIGAVGTSQFVTEYMVSTDTYRTLVEVPGHEVGTMTGEGTSTILVKKIEKESIQSLTADLSGKKLYFLGSFDAKLDGQKLFEVVLEK